MCTVKPYHILAERFRLFAVRHPSLSRRKMDLGCGITLDIFTHVFHGLFNFIKIYKKNTSDIKKQNDALDEGYNVELKTNHRTKKQKYIQQYKIQCNGLGDGYNVATCK